MKKIKYLITSFAFVPIITTSAACQSSFYDVQKSLDAEYSAKIHQLYNSYVANLNQLRGFFSDDFNVNSAYNYFNSRLNKATAIGKFVEDVLSSSRNIVINNLLKLDNSSKDIGYFDSNNTFVSQKSKLNEILNELSYNQAEYVNNFVAQMTNFQRLNVEMFEIIKSDIKIFDSWSFKKFANIFRDYPDWPLFKNTEDPTFEKELFNDSLNNEFKRLNLEFESKIYNQKMKNIDYSKLGSVALPDGSQGHLHALINLWNEWNSMTFILRNSEGDLHCDSNNKYILIEDFIAKFKRLNNYQNDLFIVRKDNLNDKFNLSAFVKDLEKVYQTNSPEIYSNTEPKTKFTKALLEPAEKLLKIAEMIIAEVKYYQN
ncbi:MAG0770 family lipoprotein [Mycoplasmopsis iners]|uniref:MAG0770 family lipoprotein n=1 Tax=Mycoplasmopsis iners TaxID=76630 RepID=UPI000497F091|nr:hypothetical protein [Mycoplasmopsis iners]